MYLYRHIIAVLIFFKEKSELCVYVGIPFILDVRLVDAPAGVTQEEGHTGFLHLPSEVLALIFLARGIQPSLSLVDREVARGIQPSLSLVDREVDFCVLTH